MIRFLFLLLFAALPGLLSAKEISIDDFTIKENLSQNGKLAIIALDSADKADNSVYGTFQFTINGFQHTLKFVDGVSVLNDPIESSTFTMIKHKNRDKEVGKYYYVRKTDDGLRPIQISGLLLIAIPIAILLIGYMFKRFLVVFVVLGLIFAYFHFSQGMEISQLFESFFMGLKNFF